MDADTKRVRYSRQVESLLKQFQKWGEGGAQAQNKDYDRGYIFAFEWPQWRKDMVNNLMSGGSSFEEAFDFVMSEKFAPESPQELEHRKRIEDAFDRIQRMR